MRFNLLFLFLCLSATFSWAQQAVDLSPSQVVSKVIAEKEQNDPRKVLNEFSYSLYQKVIVTDSLGTSTHSYLSEKVSTLNYNDRVGFKEQILGFQQAGFEQPRYEVLAVTLQSRSFYDKNFVIFNTRYAGVFSKAGLKNYTYTIVSQTDDDITISFTPNNPDKIPGLTGTAVIDKQRFAIKDVSVSVNDKIKIKLRQEYAFAKAYDIYIPTTTELFIDKGNSDERLSFFGGRISIGTLQNDNIEDMISKKYLVARSKITNFKPEAQTEPKVRQHTITINEGAENQDENFWQQYRAEGLSNKDKRSFSEIQKIVAAENIERRLGTINNFSIGYYSVNFFDFDLTYPVKFNNYEGLRLGLGGVTNAGFSDRFRLEGYGAYGFKDKEFKYGGGSGILLDKNHGAWLSLTYSKDLEEVGSFAYLTDRRVYSLFEPRLVNINLFYKHRTTRINLEYRLVPEILTELQFAHRRIEQTTPYTFLNNGDAFRNYQITEATASLRWTPGSKFLKSDNGTSEIVAGQPIFSVQVSQALKELGGDFEFTRIGAKAFYKLDNLNESSTEILAEGNFAFGNIPITHLFHAYPNAPTKETILQRFSVAGVNSFETMFFGEFFSDRLVTAQVKHRLRPFNFGKRFKPQLVFISRFAIGDAQQPEAHIDIPFDTLDKGYTESGFEINKIFWGFGTSLTYRYGAYHLPNFGDNIAFKFTFNLKL